MSAAAVWQAHGCEVLDGDGAWVADCSAEHAPLLAASGDLLAALEAHQEAVDFTLACPDTPTLSKEIHDQADFLFNRAADLRAAAIARVRG